MSGNFPRDVAVSDRCSVQVLPVCVLHPGRQTEKYPRHPRREAWRSQSSMAQYPLTLAIVMALLGAGPGRRRQDAPAWLCVGVAFAVHRTIVPTIGLERETVAHCDSVRRSVERVLA